MYSDPLGTAPEWWQWVISGAMFVAGVALVATGLGGAAGGALICAGANSIINSFLTEASGGSSTAGWFGGLISGAFSGFGAGVAGDLIVKASESVGIACLGYFTKGISVAFAFGTFGSGTGAMVTAAIDRTEINALDLLETSVAGVILNVGAGLLSGIGTAITGMPYLSETSKVVANAIATGENIVAEAIIDSLNVLISLFG